MVRESAAHLTHTLENDCRTTAYKDRWASRWSWRTNELTPQGIRACPSTMGFSKHFNSEGHTFIGLVSRFSKGVHTVDTRLSGLLLRQQNSSDTQGQILIPFGPFFWICCIAFAVYCAMMLIYCCNTSPVQCKRFALPYSNPEYELQGTVYFFLWKCNVKTFCLFVDIDSIDIPKNKQQPQLTILEVQYDHCSGLMYHRLRDCTTVPHLIRYTKITSSLRRACAYIARFMNGNTLLGHSFPSLSTFACLLFIRLARQSVHQRSQNTVRKQDLKKQTAKSQVWSDTSPTTMPTATPMPPHYSGWILK